MMTICFRNVAGQRDRSQMRPCEAHLLLQIWNKGSASYMNCWVISPAKRERKYDLRRDKIESCLYISRCETKVHYVIQSVRSLVQQKVFAFFSYQKQGGWTIVQIQQSRHLEWIFQAQKLNEYICLAIYISWSLLVANLHILFSQLKWKINNIFCMNTVVTRGERRGKVLTLVTIMTRASLLVCRWEFFLQIELCLAHFIC